MEGGAAKVSGEKKRKRRGARLSKSERLAKRAAAAGLEPEAAKTAAKTRENNNNPAAPPPPPPPRCRLDEVVELAREARHRDAAERVANAADAEWSRWRSGAAEVRHAVAFFAELARLVQKRPLAHYARRIQGEARRVAIGEAVVAAVAAESVEAAALAARSLGAPGAALQVAHTALDRVTRDRERRNQEVFRTRPLRHHGGETTTTASGDDIWGLSGAMADAGAPLDGSALPPPPSESGDLVEGDDDDDDDDESNEGGDEAMVMSAGDEESEVAKVSRGSPASHEKDDTLKQLVRAIGRDEDLAAELVPTLGARCMAPEGRVVLRACLTALRRRLDVASSSSSSSSFSEAAPTTREEKEEEGASSLSSSSSSSSYGASTFAAIGAAVRCEALGPEEAARREALARRCVDRVATAARVLGEGATARLFGSSATQMLVDPQAPATDVDVVVLVPGGGRHTETNRRTLNQLKQALVGGPAGDDDDGDGGGGDYHKGDEAPTSPMVNSRGGTAKVVTKARVPVLQCAFEEEEEQAAPLVVECVVNNVAAVANTAMLSAMGRRCGGFAALVRAVKRWARRRAVAGAKRRHLSSYGWAVLSVFAARDAGLIRPLELAAARDMAHRRDAPAYCAQDDAAALLHAVDAEVEGAVVVSIENNDDVASEKKMGGKETTLTEKDDAALGRRFVHLLGALAFRRADVLSPRAPEALHSLKPPPLKHRDRLRVEDPIELGHDLAAVLTKKTCAKLRHAALLTLLQLHANNYHQADSLSLGQRPKIIPTTTHAAADSSA